MLEQMEIPLYISTELLNMVKKMKLLEKGLDSSILF
jgi:hypothetical protein